MPRWLISDVLGWLGLIKLEEFKFSDVTKLIVIYMRFRLGRCLLRFRLGNCKTFRWDGRKFRHHSIYLNNESATVCGFKAYDLVFDVEHFLQPCGHPLIKFFVRFDFDFFLIWAIAEWYHLIIDYYLRFIIFKNREQ